MKFRESETLELKRSTSELKEAVISIGAILNKHGRGRVYLTALESRLARIWRRRTGSPRTHRRLKTRECLELL